jgi:opacity protein-like surface antigen
MNPRLAVAVAVLLVSSLWGSHLHAADGLYLGAGIGVASVKDQVNTETFDSDDASFKAFVGWRFDLVPVIDLTVEAAYTEFGRPSQRLSGQDVRVKLKGPSLAGLLIFPLGPVDLYGKAGVIEWKSERSVAGTTESSSGSDAFYGAGIGLSVWKIGFRAEYERFEIKDVDRVQMLSVSALFQF